jgi:ATP-dependent helicase HrpB
MLNGIREKGLSVLNWTPEAEQYRIRLHCAAWLPEEAGLRWMTRRCWLAGALAAAANERRTLAAALKALDVKDALQNLLDWSLRQRLDSELPGHYTVPTGSRIAIRYHEDNPPALAVRMQEMFGEATTPSIAEGRVPLVLELLSPAHRPLQITRDLGAFWAGATVKCKKR